MKMNAKQKKATDKVNRDFKRRYLREGLDKVHCIPGKGWVGDYAAFNRHAEEYGEAYNRALNENA